MADNDPDAQKKVADQGNYFDDDLDDDDWKGLAKQVDKTPASNTTLAAYTDAQERANMGPPSFDEEDALAAMYEFEAEAEAAQNKANMKANMKASMKANGKAKIEPPGFDEEGDLAAIREFEAEAEAAQNRANMKASMKANGKAKIEPPGFGDVEARTTMREWETEAEAAQNRANMGNPRFDDKGAHATKQKFWAEAKAAQGKTNDSPENNRFSKITDSKPSKYDRKDVNAYSEIATGTPYRRYLKGIYLSEVTLDKIAGTAQYKESILGGVKSKTEYFSKDAQGENPSTFKLNRKEETKLLYDKTVNYNPTDGSKTVERKILKGQISSTYEQDAEGKRQNIERRVGYYVKRLGAKDADGSRTRDVKFGKLYARRHEIDADDNATQTGRRNLLNSKYTTKGEGGAPNVTKIKQLGGLINKTYEVDKANGEKTVTARRVGLYRMKLDRANAENGETRTKTLGKTGRLHTKTEQLNVTGTHKYTETNSLFGLQRSGNLDSLPTADSNQTGNTEKGGQNLTKTPSEPHTLTQDSRAHTIESLSGKTLHSSNTDTDRGLDERSRRGSAGIGI